MTQPNPTETPLPQIEDLAVRPTGQDGGDAIPNIPSELTAARNAIAQPTLPGTMELIVASKLPGLASEANWRSMIGWASETASRNHQVQDDLRRSNEMIEQLRKALNEERERRITAEATLKGIQNYRTLRELGQAGGVFIIMLGIEIIKQPNLGGLGYTLIAFGTLLGGVALYTARIGQKK
jgi:hypothetical protein